MHHNLCIHSSVSGHLGCFHVLATVKSAATNVKPVIKSEVSQKEKDKYYLLTHVSEKAMAPHSSTLAWKIPWMEEPGRL